MKRNAIKRRPLADTVLSTLEPEEKEYREAYGVDRLYFVVSPTGRKRWEARCKRPATGRWAWMGLGAYPDTTAKVARLKAREIADLVAEGIDPVTHKATAEGSNPFRATAEEWFQYRADQGRAEKTLKSIRYWLDNDALPALGDKSLGRITRGDCAALQSRIEARGAFNTAEKSRSWLNAIFGYAIGHSLCDNNPASNLADIAAPAPEGGHYPHLLEPELPEFLRALRQSTSKPIVQVAARMVLRTASRPGMVRFAEWSEIDGDLWHVPGPKMKMKRDHIVPLSRQVLEDLEALRVFTGRSKYLFPGEGAKSPVISDAAINKAFANVGYARRMTGHGSRHTATTLLTEHGWPEAWTDAQLSHSKAGLRGVYDKAAYLAKRRVMMQWYADYLDALEAGMTAEQRKQFEKRVLHR